MCFLFESHLRNLTAKYAKFFARFTKLFYKEILFCVLAPSPSGRAGVGTKNQIYNSLPKPPEIPELDNPAIFGTICS